jgi:hypothetical protein
MGSGCREHPTTPSGVSTVSNSCRVASARQVPIVPGLMTCASAEPTTLQTTPTSHHTHPGACWSMENVRKAHNPYNESSCRYVASQKAAGKIVSAALDDGISRRVERDSATPCRPRTHPRRWPRAAEVAFGDDGEREVVSGVPHDSYARVFAGTAAIPVAHLVSAPALVMTKAQRRRQRQPQRHVPTTGGRGDARTHARTRSRTRHARVGRICSVGSSPGLFRSAVSYRRSHRCFVPPRPVATEVTKLEVSRRHRPIGESPAWLRHMRAGACGGVVDRVDTVGSP